MFLFFVKIAGLLVFSVATFAAVRLATETVMGIIRNK